VQPSVTQLLADVTTREPMRGVPGTTESTIERVSIGGRPHVVKHINLARDWTVHAAGVIGAPVLAMWRKGLFDRLPACINQPIIGVASQPGQTSVLMHDVSQWLVPSSDEPIPLAQHLRFLDHMAQLHASFWQGGAELEVVPLMHRYLDLSPWLPIAERSIGSTMRIPQLVDEGWRRLVKVAPKAARIVAPLAWDPGPLVMALESTPATFVHGCLKFDNMGSDVAGRTVLIDWELPGRAPACSDLAWYLAINCRRIPQTKEDAIVAYRDALERHHIDTTGWWDRQLALCLLGEGPRGIRRRVCLVGRTRHRGWAVRVNPRGPRAKSASACQLVLAMQ
jgi:hypothetical protein